MKTCNLLVRSCSRIDCLMQKVPAVNGRSTASAAVFRFMFVTNNAQIFQGVLEGELRAIIKERGQIISVRVETHNCQYKGIDSEGLSSCVRSLLVQHGLHVVRIVGHEGKVISKQHVGRHKIWSASKRAFLPICHTVRVVQVDGKQQRGEWTTLLNTERWLHRSCFVPIQQRTFISMIQIFQNGQDMVRHLATA